MPDDLLSEARAALQAGQRREASALLMAFVRSHPSDGEAWYLLAQALDDADQKNDSLNRAIANGYRPPAPPPVPAPAARPVPAPPGPEPRQFTPLPMPEPETPRVMRDTTQARTTETLRQETAHAPEYRDAPPSRRSPVMLLVVALITIALIAAIIIFLPGILRP